MVELQDLPDGSGILQDGAAFLLDAQDDRVVCTDGDSAEPSVDSLHGVFDLEEVSRWREDGDSGVVS